MMQAIVKVCLAVGITMSALAAGTASGEVSALGASDEAVPEATCSSASCAGNCIKRGFCDGDCVDDACVCVRRRPPVGCP